MPLRGNLTEAGIMANGIYMLVTVHAKQIGIDVAGLGGLGLRLASAANTLLRKAASPKSKRGRGTCQHDHNQDLINGRMGRRILPLMR